MISVYTTLMILLSDTFIKYSFADEEETGSGLEVKRLLFFCSWVFKGLFGYVADKVFLFKYRSKGYISLLALANAVLAGLCLWSLKSDEPDRVAIQVFILICIFNLAFLDSVTRRLRSPQKESPR